MGNFAMCCATRLSLPVQPTLRDAGMILLQNHHFHGEPIMEMIIMIYVQNNQLKATLHCCFSVEMLQLP